MNLGSFVDLKPPNRLPLISSEVCAIDNLMKKSDRNPNPNIRKVFIEEIGMGIEVG
ncbi:hypothetical protein HanXRQr2_Chr04g0141531 [Helianthus annuus]|uniref:Uncharacterized protein n=1 Tax=Helianthus annuus TaxID=4232 RepID=A0A9K3J4G0_HELAN|nr:hypothetical protein HanXRQr2_Chr04g0141531 [Helianthus annuus]KAJ0929437.1 hypothetical protein HanPSC8_Chr04g0137681 [Helianthus annuus]